jgi:adenylate cyclase
MVAPFTQLNLTVVLAFISDFALERMERTHLRHTFERYVSRDVVEQMLDNPKGHAELLGGVIRPVTVLFADIRGYSLVSARSDPHVLVSQLNEYLTAMVECVFRFGGTLDKFIGDAFMAVWGNVHSRGPHQDAVNAVRAALEMRVALDCLNQTWRARGLSEFRVGTALNHGEVVVGNIGSPHRMEFTVIGDAVNVSWKLQELTKELGHDLIVSRQVRDLVVEYFDLRSIGHADLPALRSSIELFAVSGPVEFKPEQTTVRDATS